MVHVSSCCFIWLLLNGSSVAFSPSHDHPSIKTFQSKGRLKYYVSLSTSKRVDRNFVNSKQYHRPLNLRYQQPLYSSTIDMESDCINNQTLNNHQSNRLLILHDILPISLFIICCLISALLLSTYEDYDVTHVRPNPSTLRRPTSKFNFVGAATKGMGWGVSDRISYKTIEETLNTDSYDEDFEEWYGASAATLQWKPSYNEIMAQHRLERVPRWIKGQSGTSSFIRSTDEAQQAVMDLYKSLNELNDLKLMADNYQWEDIKDVLNPKNPSCIRHALEYSLDVIKFYSISNHNNYQDDVPTVIGFDWGSCAWRHCGAKADGQEALAELYSSVGMLEPFECRFVIGTFVHLSNWCL